MIATPTTIANTANTDIDALKTRLKATWMDGNYDFFSRFMKASAHEFLDRLGVDSGTTLLDVACGSGQLALIAARIGAKVTGVDIATNAIAAARGRAESEGLDARFDEGDAEALPYEVASFDFVTSLFGAMFAPRPELVASESPRVCRPGGTIAMGNWTSEGFIGQMFKTFTRFIAPPGMPSPVLWGDENTVRERFGARVSDLRLTRVIYRFDYPFSPADVVEFFRQNYGPTTRAFAALGAADQTALREELVKLWASHNQSKLPQTNLGGRGVSRGYRRHPNSLRIAKGPNNSFGDRLEVNAMSRIYVIRRTIVLWFFACTLSAIAASPDENIVRVQLPDGRAIPGVVPVSINGAGPFNFMLDTGNNTTDIDRKLADQLSLPTVGEEEVTGIAGEVAVSIAHSRSISIAGLAVRDLNVNVLSGPCLPPERTRRVRGGFSEPLRSADRQSTSHRPLAARSWPDVRHVRG